MVDTITDSDVERLDKFVDPTALSEDAVTEAFSDVDRVNGEARRAFGERVAQKREPIQQDVRRELIDSLGDAGANNRQQVYGSRTSDGQTVAVGAVNNLRTEVTESGDVIAENTSSGTRAKVGEVDLDRRR